VIEVRRAAGRFRTDQPGISTWHCFSAGAHYDPGNLSFGALVGVDEHLVQPGAGFDWHAHRGVRIVSWVLDGVLRHEDGNGPERLVGPGELLVQSSGDGIRHRETNASEETLRFVQTTVLDPSPASVRAAGGGVDVRRDAFSSDGSRPAHLFVARGEFAGTGVTVSAGDSIRLGAGAALSLGGDGELLVLAL
jgi:mannose-6-phosphate isomerase-like protein (cupin superfamily)